MAEREHKRKSTSERREATEDVAAEDTAATSGTGDKLKAEMDELLDEIDDVLETNAEEFVKSYIQKGGQ